VIDFSRRRLLAAIAAGFVAQPALDQSAASDLGKRLSQALQSGIVSGLHALLVAQGGDLLLEHYRRGEDEAWDRPLGVIRARCAARRALRVQEHRRSAGIALAARKLPPPEAKLYDQPPPE
jgi:hypothetical protein